MKVHHYAAVGPQLGNMIQKFSRCIQRSKEEPIKKKRLKCQRYQRKQRMLLTIFLKLSEKLQENFNKFLKFNKY